MIPAVTSAPIPTAPTALTAVENLATSMFVFASMSLKPARLSRILMNDPAANDNAPRPPTPIVDNVRNEPTALVRPGLTSVNAPARPLTPPRMSFNVPAAPTPTCSPISDSRFLAIIICPENVCASEYANPPTVFCSADIVRSASVDPSPNALTLMPILLRAVAEPVADFATAFAAVSMSTPILRDRSTTSGVRLIT